MRRSIAWLRSLCSSFIHFTSNSHRLILKQKTWQMKTSPFTCLLPAAPVAELGAGRRVWVCRSGSGLLLTSRAESLDNVGCVWSVDDGWSCSTEATQPHSSLRSHTLSLCFLFFCLFFFFFQKGKEVEGERTWGVEESADWCFLLIQPAWLFFPPFLSPLSLRLLCLCHFCQIRPKWNTAQD